jgi:hypothetical protein
MAWRNGFGVLYIAFILGLAEWVFQGECDLIVLWDIISLRGGRT